MTITRRRLLTTATAGLALAVLPRWRAHASLSLGDWQIDTLSDGVLTLPPDFLFGPMPKDRLATALEGTGIDPTAPLTPPCNVTLLRGRDRVVLVDVGSGTAFQDGVGLLPDALDALGVAPEDVTDVIFTHAHPDHLWGVLDDFDDPMFPEARHVIGETEYAYWTDPATLDSIGAARQAFAVGATRRLESLADSLEVLPDTAAFVPGVMARSTPGHTPGHLAFEVDGGAAGTALIVGDAIGNDHVAFTAPDMISGADQDRETAVQTRTDLLAEAASEGTAIVGYHLRGGGLGRVETAGAAYRFVPEG